MRAKVGPDPIQGSEDAFLGALRVQLMQHQQTGHYLVSEQRSSGLLVKQLHDAGQARTVEVDEQTDQLLGSPGDRGVGGRGELSE
jgi:hypothetical protein